MMADPTHVLKGIENDPSLLAELAVLGLGGDEDMELQGREGGREGDRDRGSEGGRKGSTILKGVGLEGGGWREGVFDPPSCLIRRSLVCLSFTLINPHSIACFLVRRSSRCTS